MFRRRHPLAEVADRNRVVIQKGDRDVISVLRALHAYLNIENASCAAWLDHADPDELDSVEHAGISNVVHRLLRNWCVEKTSAARNSPIPAATFVARAHNQPSAIGSTSVGIGDLSSSPSTI